MEHWTPVWNEKCGLLWNGKWNTGLCGGVECNTILYGGKVCRLGGSTTEPLLLNVYGAPELIPRNEFRQPM